MRKSIMLLTIAALFAACSDDSPTGPGGSMRTPSGAAASMQPVAVAAAKGGGNGPTVTTVTSALGTIDGISNITWGVVATCPAGTQVVGGGYKVEYGWTTSHVITNAPDANNGWIVLVTVDGASKAAFRAYATCIQ